MLIGVGGSGKQTLTKFGTYILGYDVFTVQIIKGKAKSAAAMKQNLINAFHDKMRDLLIVTGVECK
jgi:adenylate kinase